MQNKLTLRLDDSLIQHAKSFAKQHNKSLSQVVSDYFELLTKDADSPEIPPITQSLTGLLENTDASQDVYKKYLEKKYF